MSERVEGLRRLSALIGLWDTATRIWPASGLRPLETDGSVEKDWALGGHFLREDLAGVDHAGQPHMGIGYIGYDPGSGTYQSVWMNTAVSGMSIASGKPSTDGDIVFHGYEPNPAKGPARRFRATLRIESTERHVVAQDFLLVDDEGRESWEPGFEVVYTRVAGLTPADDDQTA